MTRYKRQTLNDWLDKALEHHRAQRLEAAGLLYQAVLDQEPRHAAALHFSGVLAWQGGDCTLALERIRQALALTPGDAQAHSNLGNVLRQLGRSEEAEQSYRRAVALSEGNPDLWLNLGVMLRERQDFAGAEAAYQRALQLQPESAIGHNNLGNVWVETRRWDAALAAFDRALALQPRYPDAYSNRANVLNRLGRADEALEDCARALELQPGHVRAQLVRGDALLLLDRFSEAAQALDVADQALPGETFLAGKLLFARQSVCDWTDHGALLARIEAEVLAGVPVATAWTLLLSCDKAAVQRQAARQFVSHATRAVGAHPPPSAVHGHERIRLAYLSADFRNHATTYLAARLFELHDPRHFEVTLVSLQPARADEMRERLQRAPVEFLDAAEMDDAAVVQALRSRQIDVVIDLQGLTRGDRLGILARRAAPLQMSYLGYPGTLGAGFVDYLIADATLVPPGSEDAFDEQVIRLPDSYQVNDDSRCIAPHRPTRAETGLPGDAFVFCCFNHAAKITPAVFAVWMRLLHQVGGSVLWLFESDRDASQNLRNAARAHGVSPDRLVFAPRLPQAEHLARHRLADLALDTLPYNAHTTASDALWSGLPLVTCLGNSFAARVGASLLRAASLPELVTHDLAEYEALAATLATTPTRLQALRERLGVCRASHALFDSQRFTRHLEAAFSTAVARHRQGLPAAGFSVGALPTGGTHAACPGPDPGAATPRE